jgi:potassium-transporting ATPase KdpC subunit
MKNLFIAIKLFIILSVITGLIYPFAITGIGQIVFPHKANGSMIKINEKIIGSELIGQKFDSTIYFWGRPSAIDYNPMPSGGSNLNPVGTQLKDRIQICMDSTYAPLGYTEITKIPKDLLFASASGVDPHISPEAACFQVDRVAEARKFSEEKKKKLIELINKSIELPDLFIFGEPRVNVLLLNLQLKNI